MGFLRELRRHPTFIPTAAGTIATLALLGLYIFMAVRPAAAVRPVRAFFAAVDGYVFDLMFTFRGPEPATGQVVLVDIDEQSLRDPELGQWPWPRDRIAAILKRIHAAKPKAVALDIIFAEPDRTSPARYVAELKDFIPEPIPEEKLAAMDRDVILGEALKDTPTVLGYFFLMSRDSASASDQMPFPGWTLRLEPHGRAPNELDLMRAEGVVLNVEPVRDWAETEGFFTIDPMGMKGVLRRAPLLMRMGEAPYPSLAFEALRLGLGETEVVVTVLPSEQQNIQAVRLGELEIPTDGNGFMVLNYRGPSEGTFHHESAADVYHGRVPPASFAGKYVVMGASAGGLHDLKVTPFTNVLPGPEVHATIIDNALAGDALRHAREEAHGIIIILIVVGGLALTLVLGRTGAGWGAAAGVAVVVGVFVVNYYAGFLRHYLLGVTYPAFALAVVFVVVTIFNFLFVGREARFVRDAFAHYLAPGVVEALVRSPESLRLGGEKKVLSVMFSDIRGFTTLSESMDAGALAHFLNEYMTAMTDVIMEARGAVDKFIGDAIMALWGAPLDDPEHAANAVRAGLRMVERLLALQPQWRDRGLPAVDLGIGINTGEMTVGNMGSDTRFDYTVIGDNVNLASRLEGLNKAYGTRIIISELTRAALGERFCCRLLDRVRVKGREEPLRIYEPVCEGEPDESRRREVAAFEDILSLYWKGQWSPAKAKLTELQAQRPHPLYEVYLERIMAFEIAPPPPDWDGVWTFKTK